MEGELDFCLFLPFPFFCLRKQTPLQAFHLSRVSWYLCLILRAALRNAECCEAKKKSQALVIMLNTKSSSYVVIQNNYWFDCNYKSVVIFQRLCIQSSILVFFFYHRISFQDFQFRYLVRQKISSVNQIYLCHTFTRQLCIHQQIWRILLKTNTFVII